MCEPSVKLTEERCKNKSDTVHQTVTHGIQGTKLLTRIVYQPHTLRFVVVALFCVSICVNGCMSLCVLGKKLLIRNYAVIADGMK